MSQVWFITGSSRGLGREIALAALEAGYKVVATARRPADLDDLIAKYKDAVLALALDVSDAGAAQKAIATAKAHFGRLDVVVNNAGYANTAALEDMALKDFEQQMATNFSGTVYVTKAAIPVMREQGSGHIIQIASIGARMASVGLSAYQAAKFAMRGFSLVVAQEVAPLGIKVTIAQPGGIRTDWSGSSMEVPPISAPYQQTVGPFAEMLRANTGKESSDPAKIAQALLTIAGRDDAPVDLLIGADAWSYWQGAKAAADAADEQWKELTHSVTA